MNIVFFGTPEFAAKILDFLLQKNHRIVAIVTRPDKPKGRSQKLHSSEVKILSQKKIPTTALFQPERASTEEFAQTLHSFEPDVFVVVAYGEIIKANLLKIPKKMCINVHPSLLPKYRGAAPIQRTLMDGEKETGVTIIEMALEMDAGKILEVKKTPIDENSTFGELEKILCNLSCKTLESVLEKIQNNTIKKILQNHDQATFAPKISFEDRIIDWEKPALEIHNQIRALSPYPGAFCFINLEGEKKRLGIKRTKKGPDREGKPGQILEYKKNEWIVACGKGTISLLEVQLEGKKVLSIEEFIRGISKSPQISC